MIPQDNLTHWLITTQVALVQQVQHYFAPANLAKDTYLKSLLDPEGYVDLAALASFPHLSAMTAGVDELARFLLADQKKKEEREEMRQRVHAAMSARRMTGDAGGGRPRSPRVSREGLFAGCPHDVGTRVALDAGRESEEGAPADDTRVWSPSRRARRLPARCSPLGAAPGCAGRASQPRASDDSFFF